MKIYWLFIWTKLNPLHPRMLHLCQVWLKLAQYFWRRFFFISSVFFRYFIIISPWKRMGPYIWTKLKILHQRMISAKFGLNWHSDSWEDLKKLVNVFLLLRNDLPLEKGRTLHFNKLEFPSPALCQVWLKFAQWFWRRRFIFISSMYFRYFVIIFPWRRAGPFI